jgi:signal transduction histidine kinase
VVQWFLSRQWLPQIYLATFLFAFFGSIDAAIQGPTSLFSSALLIGSLIFTRKHQWVSTSLVSLGSIVQVLLGQGPLFAGLATSLSLILIAAFATPLLRQISVIVTNICGIVLAYVFTLADPDLLAPLSIDLANDNSGVLAFWLSVVCVVAVNTLAWVYGRLTITKLVHVGTDTDRALLVAQQAKLAIEVAKQTERLGIARDLTDLLVQRLSAVVSLSDAAKYLTKSDQEATDRVINRISESAVSSQSELRKLYDLLHQDHELAAAPPSISEIPDLVLAMRQLGFNASQNVDGAPIELNEGAQLCIFKIVFEALENVKKNAPLGTSVSVDFYWTENGLQILVKDNGVETAKRESSDPNAILDGYSVADDLESLLETIDGATLSTLRERASLYSGTIDVARVAGVGFTLAAYFPKIREVAGIE